ncbi:MAG: lytic transglycosylase domain-containing protein [Candidatus Lambdaproteobacteria bacterium]|nr:lytic transglycosylase domain-containing protein [Candidatus Lambdaproteobacteria bacterium]
MGRRIQPGPVRLMMRLLLPGLLLALLSAPGRAQDEPPDWERLGAEELPAPVAPGAAEAPREAIAREALPADCDPLEQARRSRWPAALPEPYESYRKQFLRARCELAQGRQASAVALFGGAMPPEPILREQWRLGLFQAQLELGQTAPALSALRELIVMRPGSATLQRLRELLGSLGALGAPLAGRDGREPAASAAEFAYLTAYLDNIEPAPDDFDLAARLLGLAQARGETRLTRRLPLLLWRLPKDEESARRWQQALRQAPPDAVQQPTSSDLLQRSRQLFALRLFSLLVEELETGDLAALDTETARQLGGLYFQGLTRLRAYERAATQIASEAVRRRFAFDDRLTLPIALRMQLRLQDMPAAEKLLSALEAIAPRAAVLPEFYLEMARYHAFRGNFEQLQGWTRRILAGFPGNGRAADAYWLLTWHHFRRGEYVQAARWCDQAIASGSSYHAEVRSRFYYWKGRIEQELGDEEKAQQTWEELQRRWPASFYGMLSRAVSRHGVELPRFGAAAGPPPDPGPPALQAVWSDAMLRTAAFLFIVGEERQAEALLHSLIGRPFSAAVLEELGQLLQHYRQYHLQQRLIANYFLSDLKQSPLADAPLWRFAYPQAYWSTIVQHSAPRQVDPYLVLAVMREESHFQTVADSRAGAKGLMQLMPATAQMLAKRLGLPYAEEHLLTPEGNIPLGVVYLQRVLARFGGNILLASAAYNAGPTAVARWVSQYGKLPSDEFVESIPFDETRMYVKRVYTSYLIYRELYR